MVVSVRDIAARCVWCGTREFDPVSPGKVQLESLLKCSGCGARYTYLQLLDQIGEEAIRRANKAMDELQKRRPHK
jgi:hypothetical protein